MTKKGIVIDLWLIVIVVLIVLFLVFKAGGVLHG